jgi:multidrug efflux pump subunit AcrB
MRGITAFSLNTNRVTALLLVLVATFGIVTYLDYPKQEDPSIQIREALVWAYFPGMPVHRVEDLITRKLEEQIRLIGEVDYIESDSKHGLSLMHVVVRDDIKALKPVWRDLREKLNDVALDLPNGTIGPFVNDEFGVTAVADIALWSNGFSLAEMRVVARDTRDELYGLKGIRRIDLYGVQEQQVFLELSNAKLAEYGISPSVVVQTLQQQNVILAGGQIDIRGQTAIVQPSGDFNDVSDIESIIIPIPNSDRVTLLRDLAKISRGYIDPPAEPVFFNGHQAIVLSISILEGATVNAVEFGDRLSTTLKEIQRALPIGSGLESAPYQPTLVEKAVNGAVSNLIQTLIIVLVVVMIFLGVRTGLIVGSFVPMTMLMGLVIMQFLDIELQRMSIAAMIIALGMLVDNGIVIAEDIRTRMERGQDRREAALEAGRALAVPLLTSTLTTILAFSPMILAIGSTGEYTISLGQVIVIVLLSSWFLSMYMTPLMCVWFMKVKTAPNGQTPEDSDPFQTPLYRFYRSLLKGMLRARPLVLAAAVGSLVVAGYAFKLVTKEFFPPGDRNQFLVYLDLPSGTRSDETTRVVQRLAAWLADKSVNPEVTGNIAYVGNGGPRFFLSLSPNDPDPHLAFVLVNTQTTEQVPAMVRKVRQYALDSLPEARARVKEMWLGASETGLLEVRISGQDAEVLLDKAEYLIAALRAIPGTVDIMQDWENRVLTFEVKVDQARARRAGVTSQDVATSLNAYLSGKEITDYREGDEIIPVVVRGTEDERKNVSNLQNLSVYSTKRAINVPLSQIADIRGIWELSRISRRGQMRTITVSAKHQFLKAGQLFEALKPSIDTLDLPSKYRWEIGGELEDSGDAQRYLMANLPICFALIVVLLVWQFNSFRRPAIILLTIPLTLFGAVLGLLVMKAEFGFMVILGLLSLAGIIINNGIVLIDRIDVERDAGRDAYDAIVTACQARLRPILITTVTTILGLSTLLISRDPLFYGMASAIAFGLGTGTIFTLGFVPVLYAIMFRVKNPPRGATAAPATAIDQSLA